MFGSTVLEVAIGLIFIYILLSLICTSANELLAGWMNFRAKNLEKGIKNLLYDASGTVLAKDFYEHPLIKGLYHSEKRKPSYIPSRNFALALMDIVMPVEGDRPETIEGIRESFVESKNLNSKVKKALLIMIDEAGNNLDEKMTDRNKILISFEIWFNNSMERVAGWYKRNAQIWICLFAIIITVGLNVDTISISKSLSNDSMMRASLVAAAQEAVKQPHSWLSEEVSNARDKGRKLIEGEEKTPLVKQQDIFARFKTQVEELYRFGLPIGWNISIAEANASTRQWILWWITKVFGLLLTAFAASLGAPFWFDLLNKVISIRATGKQPKEPSERK